MAGTGSTSQTAGMGKDHRAVGPMSKREDLFPAACSSQLRQERVENHVSKKFPFL